MTWSLYLDLEADALSLSLTREREIVESAEVAPGVVLDYDADGCVIGIDIRRVSHRAAAGELAELRFRVHQPE